jgi:23S rRNA (adenine2030-N6)-methyltransferase
MNYRHAFHAGNFADVVKHAVLARILVHLRDKDAAFRVIDTHAGAGLYDLQSEEAERTGEWRSGIGRLIAAECEPDMRALLAPYLDAVAAFNADGGLRWYPGSPLLAQALMRPQDRLVACELEPGAAAELQAHLRRDRRAKAVAIDGWTGLNAYVPPKERRGVVVIDPPFEARDEFARIASAIAAARRKWASGIYLIWYPIKERSGPDALAASLAGGDAKVLRVELALPGDPGRLAATGLLIVNPPWRLDNDIQRLLPYVTRSMAAQDGVRIDVSWLNDLR